jgi:hypothetical protein
MICKKWDGCGGCGTVWKNGYLIDCPRCAGRGETFGREPTFLPPRDDATLERLKAARATRLAHGILSGPRGKG